MAASRATRVAVLMRATEGLRQTLAIKRGQMTEKALRGLERIAQDVIQGWKALDMEREVLKARLGPLIDDLLSAAEVLAVVPGRAVLDGALLISVMPQAGRES